MSPVLNLLPTLGLLPCRRALGLLAVRGGMDSQPLFGALFIIVIYVC